MSRYGIGTDCDDYDLVLGYDPNMQAFWMYSQDYARTTTEKDVYRFHNLDDVPGLRMTIPMLVEVLERFGRGLAPGLARKLVQDAASDGYVARLMEEQRREELDEFNAIRNGLQANTWSYGNDLPCDWWGD